MQENFFSLLTDRLKVREGISSTAAYQDFIENPANSRIISEYMGQLRDFVVGSPDANKKVIDLLEVKRALGEMDDATFEASKKYFTESQTPVPMPSSLKSHLAELFGCSSAIKNGLEPKSDDKLLDRGLKQLHHLCVDCSAQITAFNDVIMENPRGVTQLNPNSLQIQLIDHLTKHPSTAQTLLGLSPSLLFLTAQSSLPKSESESEPESLETVFRTWNACREAIKKIESPYKSEILFTKTQEDFLEELASKGAIQLHTKVTEILNLLKTEHCPCHCLHQRSARGVWGGTYPPPPETKF